jgi:hypothetical protein
MEKNVLQALLLYPQRIFQKKVWKPQHLSVSTLQISNNDEQQQQKQQHFSSLLQQELSTVPRVSERIRVISRAFLLQKSLRRKRKRKRKCSSRSKSKLKNNEWKGRA